MTEIKRLYGAIGGDIIGSVYEFNNVKTKDFPLFTPESTFTDDTIMTIATADAIMHGGDSDTISAITGAVALAYYQMIPDYIVHEIEKRLPIEMKEIVEEFDTYCNNGGMKNAN